MDNERMRYIYHLDSIRQNKNLTVNEVCEGVCSDRQYRKYLSGDNNISDHRIMELCENIGISARDFYYSLNEKDVSELDSINKLYNALARKDRTNAENYIETLDKKTLTKQNMRYYMYCKIRFFYETGVYDKRKALEHIKEYIDYPECKNNNAFAFEDIVILFFITQIEVDDGIEEGLLILIRLLTNPKLMYISDDSRNVIAPIYSNVSIMLGKMQKFEDCITVSNEGIKYCIKYVYSKSLTRLYYSKAIAYKKLDMVIEAEFNAALCFANVIARQNIKEINHFYEWLYDDFDADPFDLLKKHKDMILDEEE